jgi:hypothetical protein
MKKIIILVCISIFGCKEEKKSLTKEDIVKFESVLQQKLPNRYKLIKYNDYSEQPPFKIIIQLDSIDFYNIKNKLNKNFKKAKDFDEEYFYTIGYEEPNKPPFLIDKGVSLDTTSLQITYHELVNNY